MKGYFTLYIILLSVIVKADWPGWRINPDKKYINCIRLSAGYMYNSNAVTDELALEYLNRGFITEEMKDRVTPKLENLNRLGATEMNELKYIRYPDSVFSMRNSFFSFALRNRYHINSNFSRDVFELYFRGNKGYAGKIAEASDFVFQDLVYQQLNASFGHRFRRMENEFGYSFGLSFNKGQRHYLIEADRAKIYTEPMGEYIDLDVKGELHRSDSSANNLGSFRGAGGSADFSAYWQSSSKNILTVTVENFGFITWNSRSTFISTDTLFHFDGVDVSYLFDLTDTIRKKISLDSSLVEPYLTNRTKQSYTEPVPALLKVNYDYVLKQSKSDIEAEAGYLFFASSLPYGSVTYNYLLKDKHHLGLKARFGGYGNFDAGLSYRIAFLRHWVFYIESDYLTSMFDTKNKCGHGAFFSLSSYF